MSIHRLGNLDVLAHIALDEVSVRPFVNDISENQENLVQFTDFNQLTAQVESGSKRKALDELCAAGEKRRRNLKKL